MTPFHIKLYYLLTEKNTGVGQSSHFGSYHGHHHGNRQHHGGNHHGYGNKHGG